MWGGKLLCQLITDMIFAWLSWRNWIARQTSNLKVAGSIPAGS